MRRLWAHIIIAFTCIVAAFASFPGILKDTVAKNTNGDYRTRRQFTFQLSEKKSDDVVIKSITDDSAKEVAKIMEERLIQSNITSYDISTSGSDMITVTFAANSATHYSQITSYLGFSGSFALLNEDPDGEPIVASDFLDGSAYLKKTDINEYPTLIIPVKTESEAYKGLIKWAQDNPKEESSGDDESETTKTAPIYLIYNYVEGDTYKTLSDTSKLNSKILLTFNALTDDDLYYDENHNSFSQIIGYSDSNGNGYADADEVAAAFEQADFLYNLFNASPLSYDVDLIRGVAEGTVISVDGKVENIKKESKLVWTSTLTAVVAAIAIVSLLLVVFYRLGALSVVTTTVLSTFLSFLFMALAGMEYNSIALVAFVIIAAISLISGIIYCNKLKEECYRGRTLKKANAEASRKSTLPIVDIHVVSAVIGLLLYLLGGSALHTFSSVLLLGSLASAIINIFGLKIMMWLATNTTKLTGKYEVFGVESDKVPDHMSEEKQKFFGSYADKDLTKNKKPIMIAALGLFIAAVAGISVMGALNNGNLFVATEAKVSASEIYIKDKIKVISDEKSKMTEDDVKSFLSDIKVYNNAGETVTFDDADTHATLASYVSKISTFEISDSTVVEGTTTNYTTKYFAISMNGILDGNSVYAKAKDYVADEMKLNDLLNIYFSDINTDYATSEESTISLKAVTKMNNSADVEWNKVALATFIAVAVLTVYMLIRYRLSRGLASIIYPVVNSAITLALFVLLGIAGLNLPSALVVLIPVVTVFTYAFIIMFSNKEREMIVESRDKDNSYEHRVEVSKRALGIAFTPILSVAIVGVYLFINFFGFGPSINSYIYLACLVGLLISLLLVEVTFVPVANFFYKLFMGINFEPKFRKSKKNKNAPVKQKSAEPEEAIFIGIND